MATSNALCSVFNIFVILKCSSGFRCDPGRPFFLDLPLSHPHPVVGTGSLANLLNIPGLVLQKIELSVLKTVEVTSVESSF